MLESEFTETNLIIKSSQMRAKYYLHDKSNLSSLKTGMLLTLHILAQSVNCMVVQASKSKCELVLDSDVYLHDGLEFIITMNRRLVGYGSSNSVSNDNSISSVYVGVCVNSVARKH